MKPLGLSFCLLVTPDVLSGEEVASPHFSTRGALAGTETPAFLGKSTCTAHIPSQLGGLALPVLERAPALLHG